MPAPKMKTLAIFILLLANIALAVLVLPSRISIRNQEDSMRESLCSLYEKQEITLSPETIPETIPLYVLELEENSQSDLQAAKILLGDQLLVQDDSSRYLSAYRSNLGECSFSRNGEFSARFTDSPPVQDPMRDCRKRLNAMDIPHLPLPQVRKLDNGVCTITATQTVLDLPVFSGGLTFTYTDNCLTGMDGVFFTNIDSLRRVSSEACISATDALVAFLDARYSLGWVGSSITSVYQGYVRSETAAASVVRLRPVWQLETDTGTFQIHGMTGDVSAIE